jgi:intracellular sulfur oxidation DsrE/DsrF family protein
MKILNIVETAYRGTIEEQDDTVLWFNQALGSAGADISVVLRGNAVNYAVRRQDASGLAFGDVRQTQPPRLAADVSRLVSSGIAVHVVEEDLANRAIEAAELVPGLKLLARREVAPMLGEFDHIWRW